MKNTISGIMLVITIFVLTFQSGFAEELVIQFSDPLGDNSGNVDVVNMEMKFDTDSGAYTIIVTADSGAPFSGQCRLNVNLWNPSRGFPYGLFQDTNNNNCPTTGNTFTLTGYSVGLTIWQAGDQVATSSYTALGNPPNASFFRSSVLDLVNGYPVNCAHAFPNICDEDAIAAQQVFEVQKVAIEVAIDIKPGSYPNCFNNDGNGVIPVAVFGSEAIDVYQIKLDSIVLEGFGIKAVGNNNRFLASYEDINSDGFDDLVVQIEDEDDGVLPSGDGVAILSGALNDGTPITGSDSICVVP